LTIALFVEGTTDKDVIRVLFGKLRSRNQLSAAITFRVLRGRQGVLDVAKVCTFVRTQILPCHPDLTGVVACVDMDCHTAAEIEEEKARVDRELALQSPPVRIQYHFVRFALESWISADESAWRTVFPRVRPRALPANILEECDPKQRIRGFFRSHGETFSYTQHDQRVADEIDLDAAARNCRNLAEFINRVRDLATPPTQ
jgi:hypothetical protein